MSKYTTSIETIICSQSNPTEPDIYKRIQEGCKFLFDFYYQIPNQDFKDSFEMQFCERFWNECIGYETVPLFKMKLKQRLEMLMPEVCFKYDALQKIINLENPALERQGESFEHAVNHSDATSDSTVNGTGSAQNSGKNVHSTTPANLIDADNIGKVKYADDGSMAESNSSNETETIGTSSAENNSDNTIERTFKEYGNALQGYNEWYISYHNIMKELLDALDDMFIQLLF